jgi:hypothetical protein
MLKVMLCGASDMTEVSRQFTATTRDFGGEPLYYTDGRIEYLNSSNASWEKNSRSSVADVDLCVFVAIERYGEITWTTELREALVSGKPFLVLCVKSTHDKYYSFKKSLPDFSGIADPEERKLLTLLDELQVNRISMVPFEYSDFGEVYRREASKLLLHGLRLLERRFQREALTRMLGDSAHLTLQDLAAAEEAALDELESLHIRKSAIRALAERGAASQETVVSLVGNAEQGIQRLTIQLLPQLYRTRPAENEFFADCVASANSSDDIGIIRRLIPSLLELDISAAIHAFEGLDLSEIGTRRRLATELEKYENRLTEPDLKWEVSLLLAKCSESTAEVGWLARCAAFRERLALHTENRSEHQ